MATERAKKDGVVNWEQQVNLDSQRERNGNYPYLIPKHAVSQNAQALKLMENLREYVKTTYGEASMICWFKPCKAKSLSNGIFEMWVPFKYSDFWKDYIKQNFAHALESFKKFHSLEDVILRSYNVKEL